MSKAPKTNSSRKPPEPAESHAVITEWMRRGVMPNLQPIVEHLDTVIRESVSDLQYALKWKKACYGTKELGWIIELVAYDVSVNIVFHGGSDFENPPPLGSGRSRYVKLKSLDEAQDSDIQRWVEQSADTIGWT